MKFFRDLLKVRTVWVEKSNGRWARQRRLHPALNIFFWGGVMAVLALLSVRLSAGHSLATPVAPDAIQQENVRMLAPVVMEASTDSDLDSEMLVVNNTEEPTEFIEESNAAIKVTVLPVELTPTPVIPAVQPQPDLVAPMVPADTKSYWIQIDKSEYTLSLFRGNQLVREYLIAVGRNPGDKQYVGDNRTPEGDFRVVSIENAESWSHDFRDGKGKIPGAYGPWFIRLSAKGWKGIGIHGTHAPESLGTMATEGCIRMDNTELQELKRYAYRNMRVVINP